MKTLSLLFLAASLLLTTSFNASQEPPELQEATTLTNSVVKLFNEKKYDEALPLAKRALQIRERLLPRTDQRVSDALTNLGETYIGKQDYDAARDVFKRLLQIQEERFGPEHLKLAATLDRLAPLHYRGGNFDESEAAYKRALAIREKALGSDDEQVARSAFAIAEFYRKRRELIPAAENYRRAVIVYGQVLGGTSAEFERARAGFWCLSYEYPQAELNKDIDRITKQFTPKIAEKEPDAENESVSGREPVVAPPPLAEKAPGLGPVLNGKAVKLPRPDYPAAARSLRLQGTVVVSVQIDENGNVISAKDICQGPRYLSESSVAAAMKAHFTPTQLFGVPVKVSGVIVYNFVVRF